MNDPSRRARLNAIKLTTLVRDHLGGEPILSAGEFSGGAALFHGRHAWLLLDHDPERGLGAAVGWALRHDALAVHVVADSATGLLARRAAGFAVSVSVWRVEGRLLLAAAAEPLEPSTASPEHHHQFIATMVDAGAEPWEEHGVLFGEVDGLEVCRVVDDAYTGEVRLEVGVGAHDREAFQMMHGDRPTADALAGVVAAVVAHRHPLDRSHPLGRLAQERSLRARLVETPSIIGAEHVRPLPPPVPRRNVKDAIPCLAMADIDDEPTLVVCTTGVDLDAVPFCIDARGVHDMDRCVIVMPSRDRVAVQELLAAAAEPPITILSVDFTP
jgi:hypothetical protein